MKIQLPYCFRIFAEPRATTLHGAQRGGPHLVFALTAVELVLAHPKIIIGACLRASGAPAVALMTLLQALLNEVSAPLLMLLVVATAYNVVARFYQRGADLWAVIGALSYAWVPHTLQIACVTCLVRCEVLTAEHWQNAHAPWLLILPAVYAAIALQTLWRTGSLCVQGQTQAPRTPLARRMACAAFVIFASSALLNGYNVQRHWGQMRPKLAGDVLPALQLSGINTASVSRAELAGHVTLIDFWASWCGPCMQAMPELERLHRDYAPRGLRVLAINIEANNKVAIQSLIAAQHLTLPIFEDTSHLADEMHVHVYPTSFLVDAEGRIAHVYTGPAKPADLEQRIVTLMQRAAIPAPL